jgi:hypothetical protein
MKHEGHGKFLPLRKILFMLIDIGLLIRLEVLILKRSVRGFRQRYIIGDVKVPVRCINGSLNECR